MLFESLGRRSIDYHVGIVGEHHSRSKLLLDMDDRPPSYPQLVSGLDRLGIEAIAISWRPSHTPGHWHVVIDLARELPDDISVLFCQLWLGSDPEREASNWWRMALEGRVGPNAQILFREKL